MWDGTQTAWNLTEAGQISAVCLLQKEPVRGIWLDFQETCSVNGQHRGFFLHWIHCNCASLSLWLSFFCRFSPVFPRLIHSAFFISLSSCLKCLQEQIVKLQLEKPPAGGLGFSVIGGERGIFVKYITPGGTADTSGTLQVGDRLLKVHKQCFYTSHPFFLSCIFKLNFRKPILLVVFLYRSMTIWWSACLTLKPSPPSVNLKAWCTSSSPVHLTKCPTRTWAFCLSNPTVLMAITVQPAR